MITIREAVPADSAGIWAVNAEALGYDYQEEKTAERLNFVLQKEYYKLFVAVDAESGRVVGYIHGADYDCTYFDPVVNVLALAVLEEYRGTGTGRRLMDSLEQWAGETGKKGIRLTSGGNRTEAHQFYTHIGFTMRKEQKNFMKYL